MSGTEAETEGASGNPDTYIKPQPHHWLSRTLAISASYGLQVGLGYLLFNGTLSLDALRYLAGPILNPFFVIVGAPLALLHGLVAFLFPWSLGWWISSFVHLMCWSFLCALANAFWTGFTT